MDGSEYKKVKKTKGSKKKMFGVRCEEWLLKNFKRHAEKNRITQTELFEGWVKSHCGGPWHAKAKTKKPQK